MLHSHLMREVSKAHMGTHGEVSKLEAHEEVKTFLVIYSAMKKWSI